jgi:tRNA dimethylallyltransferase
LCAISPPPILIIAGPTGVGKSLLAMAVAARAPGEIIVADSMQVYRGMDVGTGKPSPADRRAVPHHLLDICDPTQVFSAFDFARRARHVVDEVHARGRLPILVGGTGLYLRAFLKGQLSGGAGVPATRARLRAEAAAQGSAALHGRLREVDPDSAASIRPGDLVRIIRALELWELTGEPASTIRPGLWDPPRVAVSAFLVLMRERQELFRLIDLRAKRMWEEGLLAEVRRLLEAGYADDLRPLQSLGYRQALAVIKGEAGEAEALAEMQRATRNYAKRQVTWFRREPAAEWITVRGADWIEPLAMTLLTRLENARARTARMAAGEWSTAARDGS